MQQYTNTVLYVKHTVNYNTNTSLNSQFLDSPPTVTWTIQVRMSSLGLTTGREKNLVECCTGISHRPHALPGAKPIVS